MSVGKQLWDQEASMFPGRGWSWEGKMGTGAGDHQDAASQKLRERMNLWPFLNLGRIAGPLWFVDKNHKPQTHS